MQLNTEGIYCTKEKSTMCKGAAKLLFNLQNILYQSITSIKLIVYEIKCIISCMLIRFLICGSVLVSIYCTFLLNTLYNGL